MQTCSSLTSKAGNYNLNDGDGNLTSDYKTKADLLNKFFASVYVKEPDRQLPDYESKYLNEQFTEISVNVEIVKQLLLRLNWDKSMGPDNCHPRVLKEAAEELQTR